MFIASGRLKGLARFGGAELKLISTRERRFRSSQPRNLRSNPKL